MSQDDHRRGRDSSERKRTSYLKFLKEKRSELLSNDPALNKKDAMRAVVAAWNELSPEEKRSYRTGEERVMPPAVRRRSEDEPPLPRKRPLYQAPEEPPVHPLQALGRVLKALASYFLVRPI